MITDLHPYYIKNLPDWELEHDIVEGGQRAVKAKADKYLPFPVSLPTSETETEDYKRQYEIYVAGAYLVNFTKEAVNDLVSSVFNREAIHDELPQALDYINVTESAKPLLRKLGTYGHVFVLVDYPQNDETASIQTQEDQNIRAYVTIYNPLDVINWETERIGGNDILIRVVLRELFVDDNEEKTRYRELSIKDGHYIQTVFVDEVETESFDVKANGQLLDHITGLFVGIDSNTTDIDQSPILSIANTNLTHYQTTAELQHVITYQGHPTTAITDAPAGFIEDMQKNKYRITVGASNALVVEEGGNVSVLEINPNVTHYKHLDELKNSMVEQGARIKTSEKSGVESAESLRIRASSSNSTLSSMAIQVERAMKDIIQYMAEFMASDISDDFNIDLNKQFIIEQSDSKTIEVLSSLGNQGKLPNRVLYDYLANVRLIDEDEDYEALEQEALLNVPTLPIIE